MKRSRAPNFTLAELNSLLTLVEKYPVIENKKTDGATTKEKQAAWQSLASEYNALTNFSPRTVENLVSCYKNQKLKVKKIHSNEKMALKAPLLLNAIEEHGQDWEKVADTTEATSSDCKNTFRFLVDEVKKQDALHKKEINRTGGGPPPLSSSNPIIDKVKSLIGPSIEGLYTIYDGDADFMQQQAEITIEAQINPIEFVETSIPETQTDYTSERSDRLNLMRRKIDPSLESTKKGKKKINVSQSFQELADDKKNLVKAQQTLADYQIKHQTIMIEIAQEKLKFEKQKNLMELEFLKLKYELELDLLRNNKN